MIDNINVRQKEQKTSYYKASFGVLFIISKVQYIMVNTFLCPNLRELAKRSDIVSLDNLDLLENAYKSIIIRLHGVLFCTYSH
ncbi:MAG: hypothetical protein K0R78_2949 [Pelosinus sp.]|jgi:hypothetical protein|nr:hypothetical protein [Pelosinus sp.]